MILADEGLNGNIVRQIRENGFDVDWVLEINPGIPDEEVIQYAKLNKKILITEDKDFGEWIFAHKVKGLTIIFLRYEKQDLDQIIKFLNGLIQELVEGNIEASYQFITINKNKIRRRSI